MDPRDRVTVALDLVAEMDVTLSELHDLPLGSYAERAEAGSPWRRRSAPIGAID